MPCTPAKARHLFKSGKARPKRNKLGLFYVQLCYAQEPDTQPLVAGIDPGSKFEGYSVVGTRHTVLNLMAEASDHVKEAVETRRRMRRARRHRKWRRPKRFDNRLGRRRRIPPSTRSRWEAKARVIAQLQKSMPLTDIVVEDVQAVPDTTRLWYLVPARLHRRQLHRLQASTGGERKPYGGTRSLGLKRGTIIAHPKYGLCTVGGFDRKKQTLSLHAYRTNKRLTQGAKGKDCRVFSWVAWRTFLVYGQPKAKGKGSHPPQATKQGTPASSPCLEGQGYRQAEV
jgi:RRXRR protein